MKAHNVNVKTAAPESSERWGETPAFCGPVRGLDIRIAWGKAKIMGVISVTQARSEMHEVLFEAETAGYDDFSAGITTPPVMFGDEDALLTAWWKGWCFHSDCAAVRNCPGCEKEFPCPWHD